MSDTFHEKYRPATLDRVIGHEKVVTRLKGIIASEKYPSAMLFKIWDHRRLCIRSYRITIFH